jgi:hypothetical protein
MKNVLKVIGIIALIAVIGFSSCSSSTGGGGAGGTPSGPSGPIGPVVGPYKVTDNGELRVTFNDVTKDPVTIPDTSVGVPIYVYGISFVTGTPVESIIIACQGIDTYGKISGVVFTGGDKRTNFKTYMYNEAGVFSYDNDIDPDIYPFLILFSTKASLSIGDIGGNDWKTFWDTFDLDTPVENDLPDTIVVDSTEAVNTESVLIYSMDVSIVGDMEIAIEAVASGDW